MIARCLTRLAAACRLPLSPFSAPPSAATARAPRRIATAAALVAGLHLALAPVAAQAQSRRSLAVVRDAETEQLLRDYLKPILKAAGLPNNNTHVVLVNDRAFNAFVADSQRIFVNTGVVIDAKSPNEVIGVLAHETGHIAGNHLSRLHEAAARAQLLAVIGMLAGAGAVAAGAATGSSAMVGGGAAAIGGGMSVGQRSLLAYQRGEEDAADRSALTYLQRTGQSPQGMIKTFERMANDQMMAARYADPYAQSHPMARDRLQNLETKAQASPYWNAKDAPALQARHDMVRAKLAAFTGQPQSVARQFPASNTSMPARYARAILAYRLGDNASAQTQIDALLREQPNNPYFWELKGQSMLELGNPRGAVGPLQKAVSLAPNAGPIRTLYGQALVATGNPADAKKAIPELNRAVRDDPDDSSAYRYLAMAYSQAGDTAMADLATAQGYFADGAVAQAKHYAMRAKAGLKTGTPAWVQADDITSASVPKLGR